MKYVIKKKEEKKEEKWMNTAGRKKDLSNLCPVHFTNVIQT